jgi:hypothetical protein
MIASSRRLWRRCCRPTEDLQRALREVSDTWAVLLVGQNSGVVVGDLLRGWRIERTKIRFGRVALWGFYRAQFEEAWKMLDPDEPRLQPLAVVSAAEPILDEVTLAATSEGGKQ